MKVRERFHFEYDFATRGRTMRVLHVNLARGWRGGERQTLLLMQALRERGVEGALAARRGDELARRAREAGLDIVELHKPWSLQWGVARGFDIVHAHEARAHQVAAIWKLADRLPLVVTRRVSFAPSNNSFTRFKYAQADRVVAISTGVRDVLMKWGVAEKSIEVIPSAITGQDFSDAGQVEQLRERFAGKRVVGCVASLTPEKDHASLIRALKVVQTAQPDVVAVFVGDGPLRDELKRLADTLGVVIHFEGHQENPYSYYPVFDAFVLCSRDEGLGSSILDAFFYGAPVIATNVGGIPDLVRDRVTGRLVPAGDVDAIAAGIAEVLSDAPFRKSATTAARELLDREFAVKQMAQRYLGLYEVLVNLSKG